MKKIDEIKKKIDEMTEVVNGEYFLNLLKLKNWYDRRFSFISYALSKEWVSFDVLFLRKEKKEPVFVIFENNNLLISYGSAILGFEEFLSNFYDFPFGEEIKKICEYLNEKNNFLPDFKIKEKKQDFFYRTKTGEKMVNLKAISIEFGIADKPEFKEALKDGKAKRFVKFRFDEVFGEFVEFSDALHILNIYTHYAKDKQLNQIINQLI